MFNIRQVGDTIICDVNVSGTAGQHELPGTAVTAPLACSPNPFSRWVNLTLLPAGTEARVYSTTGVLVWSAKVSDSGKLVWSGRDGSGARLPDGVYLVQAGISGSQAKVVLKR